jgi:hypothetical protein
MKAHNSPATGIRLHEGNTQLMGITIEENESGRPSTFSSIY